MLRIVGHGRDEMHSVKQYQQEPLKITALYFPRKAISVLKQVSNHF